MHPSHIIVNSAQSQHIHKLPVSNRDASKSGMVNIPPYGTSPIIWRTSTGTMTFRNWSAALLGAKLRDTKQVSL